PTAVHYLTAGHALTIPGFASVVYRQLYPGVDARFYGQKGALEYDLDLAPHVSPNRIRLSFRGAAPRLAADGSLRLGSGISLQAPHAYQQANGRPQTVAARYVIHRDQTVGLALGVYNPNARLVIDPVLTFSAYLGGTALNQANAVAVDSSGNGYVAGFTLSADFPAVTGAYQGALAAGSLGPANDAFVVKVAADGSKLIYATYLGGNGDDRATGIAVDSSGAAYVAGSTTSTNFPVVGGFQATLAGQTDAFVSKLSADGSSLVYSTYLGGSSDDNATAIAVDSTGAAFVAGTTTSSDFVVTGPQTTFGGQTDAFVVGIKADGSGRLYSTFLGGSGLDQANGIALDPVGNAYVGGSTTSSDFPASTGALQTSLAGQSDGFVAEILRSGSRFGYVTYLGGSRADSINAIAVDVNGNAYAAGSTQSVNLFPNNQNGAQPSINGGTDGFAAEVNNAGNALIYGTYMGGAQSDSANAIVVDNTGSAYVAGNTTSSDFPVTTNATQQNLAGVQDGFLVKLNPVGQVFLFASYYGGSQSDSVNGLGIDANSDVYMVGQTGSPNFPVLLPSGSTLQAASNSQFDAFVAKYVIAPQGVFSPTALGFAAQAPSVASSAQAVTFTNGGELALNISGVSTTGPYAQTNNCPATLNPTASCVINVTFTPTAVGTQNGTLVVSDNAPGGSQTLPLSGSGGDFSLTVTPTAITIPAGGSANFEVDVAPAIGYTGVVALTCSGIGSAQNATCTASPTSLTMNGTTASTATITVNTTARPTLMPWLPQAPSGPWFWLALGSLALAMLGLLASLRLRGARRRLSWVGTAVLVGCSIAAVGCGGTTTNSGTLAGNYTLTFTGTAGKATHSQTVTLTVN
ncbi:MAG: SBBP repeat-containing protein, partial [Terriglobales bacterium]